MGNSINTRRCGPCNGNCNQGRTCPANMPAEACPDADDPDNMRPARGVIVSLAISAALTFLALLAAMLPDILRSLGL